MIDAACNVRIKQRAMNLSMFQDVTYIISSADLCGLRVSPSAFPLYPELYALIIASTRIRTMRREMRIRGADCYKPPSLQIFIVTLLPVFAVCPYFASMRGRTVGYRARTFDLGGAILSPRNTRPRYTFYKRDTFLETFHCKVAQGARKYAG